MYINTGNIESNAQGQVVLGVLSDTHGMLSAEAFRTLADMDPQLIVHAGDICSQEILPRLEMLAPVVAVLGNNDYLGEYGSKVSGRADFDIGGVPVTVSHIPERLCFEGSRLAICGHTHVPKIQQMGMTTVVNPGSTTRPRGGGGPTVAKIVIERGSIRSVEIKPIES